VHTNARIMRAVHTLALVVFVGCLTPQPPALRLRLPNAVEVDRTADTKSQPTALRLLTLNLAHGRGTTWHQWLLDESAFDANLDRVAAMLQQLQPDVVALQEADTAADWSGGFDHVMKLAQTGNLRGAYAGVHSDREFLGYRLQYGTALLSKYLLFDTSSHAFGTSWRDTKGFVIATLQPDGWPDPVDVISVHLDFLDDETRRGQIEQMATAVAERPREHPLVVMGDLNCTWHGSESCVGYLAKRFGLRPYQPELTQPSFPSENPVDRIDWILISEQLDFLDHQVVGEALSDHLPVFALIAPRSTRTDGAEQGASLTLR